ncbi:MAG TPA: hypothetical protein PK264_22985, partial [Hyphomicrobiaceae bacterium]|nr:hypothetical protein [Hyphomicrobiaceae bacterium]
AGIETRLWDMTDIVALIAGRIGHDRAGDPCYQDRAREWDQQGSSHHRLDHRLGRPPAVRSLPALRRTIYSRQRANAYPS